MKVNINVVFEVKHGLQLRIDLQFYYLCLNSAYTRFKQELEHMEAASTFSGYFSQPGCIGVHTVVKFRLVTISNWLVQPLTRIHSVDVTRPFKLKTLHLTITSVVKDSDKEAYC